MKKAILIAIFFPILIGCKNKEQIKQIEYLQDENERLRNEIVKLRDEKFKLEHENLILQDALEEHQARIIDLVQIISIAKSEVSSLKQSLFMGDRFFIESDLNNLINTIENAQ